MKNNKIKNLIKSLTLKRKKEVVVLDTKEYNNLMKQLNKIKELEVYN
jgi:ribonuclease HIII